MEAFYEQLLVVLLVVVAALIFVLVYRKMSALLDQYVEKPSDPAKDVPPTYVVKPIPPRYPSGKAEQANEVKHDE